MHASRPPRAATPAPPPPTLVPAPAPASQPSRRVIATARPPAEPPARRRSAPRWTLVPPLGLLVVAAVIVIIAVSSGGGGTHRPSSAGVGTTQLVLAPARAGSHAGISATVEPGQGGLVLLLRGHGLPPNTAADTYAVWLYSSQSDARLLGFVNPPVGRSGSFTNSVALPAGAGSCSTSPILTSSRSSSSPKRRAGSCCEGRSDCPEGSLDQDEMPGRSSSTSAAAPRRRYAPRLPPEQRREQLVDAALSVILEQGYGGVSMEAVARTAGVTRPVVYDHFPNLGRLLHALIQREEQYAIAQLEQIVP